MKDEADVIRVTRWMDGELRDEEIGDLLAEAPDLADQRHAMVEMGNLVREQFPPEMEVPFAEGFNRQVLRRIEEEQERSLEGKVVRLFSGVSASEWALPVAAAAALLLLLVAGLQLDRGGDFRSRVVHTYTPNPSHAAQTQAHERTGVTVIDLAGLAPIPATEQVMGYFPAGSREEPLLARTIYYDEDQRPLLVLTHTDAGEPRLRSLP